MSEREAVTREIAEASKQIWKSMKRAFLKDIGHEYDEIGERIAIPHLAALRAQRRSTPAEQAKAISFGHALDAEDGGYPEPASKGGVIDGPHGAEYHD